MGRFFNFWVYWNVYIQPEFLDWPTTWKWLVRLSWKHGSQSFMLLGHSILDLSEMSWTVFTLYTDYKYCKCIQLYPWNAWLGNSKRRCSTKGVAWPTFMITLQQCKLMCIYLSTATWKCVLQAQESVSWATYSLPPFLFHVLFFF